MDEKLKERLNKILDRITSTELLTNSGLGNEIGFYIFDYPPEAELEVRNHVSFVIEKAQKLKPDLRIAHINLFQLMIEYLDERHLLDRALNLQREKGDEALFKALKGPLHQEQVAKALVDKYPPDQLDLIIMTGVGAAWPLIRTHNLLNALHPLIQNTPLVVFYPGCFDGQTLNLFGKLKSSDDPYYRAFRLVV